MMTRKQHRQKVATYKYRQKTAGVLIFFTGILILILVSSVSAAQDYQFIDPENLKIRLDTNEPLILVDIQKKSDYQEHHFFDSLQTSAYPVKTGPDTQSLDQAVQVYEKKQEDIIIIGPRGGRACLRTHDYLVSKGIPAQKIYILKGGIKDWPYPAMLFNTLGGCG